VWGNNNREKGPQDSSVVAHYRASVKVFATQGRLKVESKGAMEIGRGKYERTTLFYNQMCKAKWQSAPMCLLFYINFNA